MFISNICYIFANKTKIMIDESSERSIRQQLSVQKWVDNGCKGTLELTTGFGKTRCAVIAITRFLSKNSGKILILVPTAVLKKQWIDIIKANNFPSSIEVMIFNTAARRNLSVDFLILDEIHLVAASTLLKVFQTVRYQMILGLTATFERLDGREILINKYAPVVDTITPEEARQKGWTAKSSVYKVLVDVDDIDVYLKYNQDFLGHFAYFDYDWNTAMGCVSDHKNRINYTNLIIGSNKSLFSDTLKECTIHAFGWNKALQARKQFIFNHPKKLELAKKILDARPNSKAITFNATIEQCKKYGSSYIIHSGNTKKKNAEILKEFSKLSCGVVHSSKSLIQGVDVPGLNLAIILYNSSSSGERIQKYGRVVRPEPGKEAEIFSIVINKTVEDQWFKKSAKNTAFIEINENELDKVLKKQDITKEEKIQEKEKFLFTF